MRYIGDGITAELLEIYEVDPSEAPKYAGRGAAVDYVTQPALGARVQKGPMRTTLMGRWASGLLSCLDTIIALASKLQQRDYGPPLLGTAQRHGGPRGPIAQDGAQPAQCADVGTR